jgi:hypothetical protein
VPWTFLDVLECGEDLGVGPCGGGVVFPAGAYVGGPDRPSVGHGDDVDVSAVIVVFSTTTVDADGRAFGGAPVGLDDRAVDADMACPQRLSRR